MLAEVQSQPHTSQVGGVPEKERTVLQLPQDKFKVAGLPSATKARIFVVEQTQPHASQVGGVPENGWIVLHLPQERFNFTSFPRHNVERDSAFCSAIFHPAAG